MIDKILMNSLSYEDFMLQLKKIVDNKKETDRLFLASFNANKIIKEVKRQKAYIEKNIKVKFVIYNNDEVGLYVGSKENLSILKRKFNFRFKELKKNTNQTVS
jgi:hypothetical protein